MTAPWIGVTANLLPPQDGTIGTVTVSEAYIKAVVSAGGIPLVIPAGIPSDDLPGLFARLDGILFTGGGDIHPRRFNGESHPRVYGVEEQRDDLEIRLAQMAAEAGKPFLGICRGIQVINVALGGSLYTDIGDQKPGALRHDYFPNIPREHLAHAVAVEAGSRLAQALGGEQFEVNSLHHQGLQSIAPAMQVTATSPDGLVEAVELPDHPFAVGVQWHPEWLQAYQPQRQLFQALIRAASIK